jgi:hypothetical protein
MIYTFRIHNKSKKAESIINMLKELQIDYDFIEFSEEYDTQNDTEILKELESRYASFTDNQNGKDWNELLSELSK